MKFNFENLTVYKKSIDFTNEVYCLTKSFPKDELFGITNQLRRASVSISLNIAEGSGRSKKDFKHFLTMAKTSIYECVAIFEICYSQNYIQQKEKEKLYNDCVELSKMISGLISSLLRTTN